MFAHNTFRRGIPRLKPPLRISRARSFHLSTLADAVVLTADSISFIHHAGLPWPLTIPLLALGVNLTLRLPLQFYTRRLVLQRNQLTPLIHAWSARHAASASASASIPPSSSSSAASSSREQQLWRLRVAGLTERSRKRIYKTWRVQRWKSLAPLLSMAPFVIVTEALRRLCGAPLGWLGRSSGLASTSTSSMLDPCLADGGCLWFVDLTAMDPYYALPLLCSALLVRSTWGRLSKEQLRALLSLETRRGRTPVARVQAVLGRTMLLVPLFPVLFADLPSAIFLYWATAFALTEVNEVILGRVLPKREVRLGSKPRGRVVMPYLLGTGHRPSQ